MTEPRSRARLVRTIRRPLLALLALALLIPGVLAGLGGAPAGVGAAATLPDGFYEETLATASAFQTTAFAFAPDGRILIAEKAGVVRVYKDGALLPAPLLDISGRVNQYEDRGLLGIAVDPAFATNGYLYLAYTYDPPGAAADARGARTSRVARYTVAGDVAATASEVVILGAATPPPSGSCNDLPRDSDCIPADGPSHNMGHLKFAPDGSLFAVNGDAGDYSTVNADSLRAQSVDSLAGKVIRINADGTGRPGNPLWNGNPGAVRSKVWAYGVRNAFRFSLRPGTDIPYVGDVGWGNWEEINVATPGANLGWPCYEGAGRQDSFSARPECQALYAQGAGAVTAPLHTYPHDGVGASVVGGVFYTGTAYPAAFQGAYFYGDYARDFIRSLRVDGADRLIPGSDAGFATQLGGPVDIAQGPDGNLYYLAIGTGQLQRIRYGTPPPPPAAGPGYLSDQEWFAPENGFGPIERNLSNGEDAAGDGQTLRIGGVPYAKGLGMHAPAGVSFAVGGGCAYFSAQVGVDDEVGDTGSVTFQVFADGAKVYDSGVVTGAAGALPVRVAVGGANALRLVVTDAGDNSFSDHADWADAQCVANSPPVAAIASPTAGSTYRIGDTFSYAGTATDAEDGALPPARLSWQLITRHCPGGVCHAHPSQLAGASGSFVVADHDDDTHLELLLTATDSGGAKSTQSVALQPRQAQLALSAAPAGLSVAYNSKAQAPTITQQIDIGGTRTVTAPTPQTLGGVTYTFARWSDGDTRAQRPVTMTDAGLTLTALFTASPSSGPTFGDVTPETTGAVEAITQLAARGIIKGCDQAASPPLFCPTDPTLRAQMAALIVRAMGWGAETPANPFPDRNGVDDELWQAVAILADRGVARGYGDGTYGTTDPVLNAQVISFITRAMVNKGYWQFQGDDGSIYPNVAAASGHRQDLVTYVHYAGPVRGAETPTADFAGWDAPSSRAWFAFALWQALESYYGVGLVP